MADPSNKTFEDFEKSTQGQSECPLGFGSGPKPDFLNKKNEDSECPSGPNPAKLPENDIDPRNMMPPPNQKASPDQPFSLSTARQSSSIPKDGTAGTWLYPSEQMFWNAMIRKGWRWKDEDPDPEQMNSIIKIHNKNNELAWQEVLKWEAFHAHECLEGPRLVKFGGKAKEFTLRAKLRHKILGYPLPYDRHDWIVNRCGVHRTYVIDYYDGGDVDENFNFSLLDVRPKMTNWSEIRKTTDFGNASNWFNLRLNNEAILDRAKTWLWTTSLDIGETIEFFKPVSNKISDYFASQIKQPVAYNPGKFLTLEEQIQQRSTTGQLPIGILPDKKTV